MIRVDSSCTMQFAVLFQDRGLTCVGAHRRSAVLQFNRGIECTIFGLRLFSVGERKSGSNSNSHTRCPREILSCTLACTCLLIETFPNRDICLPCVVEVMLKNTRNGGVILPEAPTNSAKPTRRQHLDGQSELSSEHQQQHLLPARAHIRQTCHEP
jgi:hypothetical protein